LAARGTPRPPAPMVEASEEGSISPNLKKNVLHLCFLWPIAVSTKLKGKTNLVEFFFGSTGAPRAAKKSWIEWTLSKAKKEK